MRECSLSLGQEVYVGESSEVDTVQDNTSKKQKKGILMTAGLFLLELMIVLSLLFQTLETHKETQNNWMCTFIYRAVRIYRTSPAPCTECIRLL